MFASTAEANEVLIAAISQYAVFAVFNTIIFSMKIKIFILLLSSYGQLNLQCIGGSGW